MLVIWLLIWKSIINAIQSWSWSYGSWIYNYLCNQCLSPLMLWVWISIRARCITFCDKVCQWTCDKHLCSLNDRQQYIYTCKQTIKKPPQIHFHSKRQHTITKMIDNINIDSTIDWACTRQLYIGSTIDWAYTRQLYIGSTYCCRSFKEQRC
jgi:hypothetical protein